jgi:hypothetical protein
MTAPAEPDMVQWDDHADALLDALLVYQARHRAWIEAPEETKPLELSHVRQAINRLWPLLELTVATVARSWSTAYRQRTPGTASYAEATADLSVILCMEILGTLPRVTFEPDRNPAPLLRTIARRRAVDEYRRWSRATDPGERAPPSSDPNAEQRSSRIREISLEDTLLSALAEASSLAGGAFEAALIEQIDRHTLLTQIAQYWNRELTHKDWLLVHERYIKDPPTPYEELITQLGADWSSARARKRLSRILERTAAFLEQNGFRREG